MTPRRRASDRLSGRLARAERVAGIVLLAAMLVLLIVERDARIDADRLSLAQRAELEQRADTIECTVRGVLELSRDRARAQGRLEPEVADLYQRALEPLRRDCAPLVIAPEPDPPPPPGGRPR